MASTSPLSLPDKMWGRPNATRVKETVNDRPEQSPISMAEAEDLGAVDPDLSLREILSRALKSDGMPMLITFKEEPRSERVSVSMQALVLPFTLDELAARMSSPAKKRVTSPSNLARFGDVYVDFCHMEASRSSGERIAMTAQEFKTLRVFVANPGRVITRDELLNQAWGYENYPNTRTVDNHVLRLRQKLETDPSHPKHLLTVHSVGYKFLP